MHISELFRARVFTRPDGYVLGVGSSGTRWKILQRGFALPEERRYRFEAEHFDSDVTSHDEACCRIALWEYGGFEEVRLSPGEDERWDFTILGRNPDGVIVGPVPGLQTVTGKAAGHQPVFCSFDPPIEIVS